MKAVYLFLRYVDCGLFKKKILWKETVSNALLFIYFSKTFAP